MRKNTGLKKTGLLIMRLTLIQIFTAIIFANLASAKEATAQSVLEHKIVLQTNSQNLIEILSHLEKQAKVSFVYQPALISKEKKYSLNINGAPLSEVLDKLVISNGIKYRLIGKRIVLSSVKLTSVHLMLPTILSYSEIKTTQTVTGTVTDESNVPIPGVSIVVKGTGLGIISDAEGKFQIEVPNSSSVLVFSFVGFEKQERAVGSSSQLSIVMKTDVNALKEVVVVGYGTQKKVNMTGAVNTVNNELITNRSVSSLTNALQGTIPGMTILARPGDISGDIGTINVRGRGNLGASEPFFVVDGVPVSAAFFARINPADVESISVLKDAASSAIYGSRAANGVILVTTKKGKGGKMSINYNGYYGSQKALILPDILGSNDYAMLRNEAFTNAGKAAPYNADALAKIKSGSDPDLYPNTDWYSLALRKSAPIWDQNISFSGGDKTRYFIGGGIFRQESLKRGKDLNRYSFRSNIESQVTKNFKVGTNLSIVREGLKMDNGDFSFVALNRITPLTVAKHSDGTWGSIAGGQATSLATDNPLRTEAEGGRNSYYNNRLLGSINASLKIIDGLTVDGQLSYNHYNQVKSAFTSEMKPLINFLTKAEMPGTGRSPNNLKEEWDNQSTFMAQVFGNYEKTFGKHYAKIMVGTSYEDSRSRYLMALRKNFVNNSLNAINGGSTANGNLENAGSISERAFNSYFSRLNYVYDDKYLLEANVRWDASSQFSPDYRWGVFPSFSAGWRISQEAFLKDVSWLTELKLRGSWGILGNTNNVGNYDYFDALKTGTGAILDQGKVDGVWPFRVANTKLTWEEVNMANIGLDGGLWNNRFTFQLDVFDKMTKNILLRLPQPTELGLHEDNGTPANDERPLSNAARVQNRGIELSLGHNNRIGDFNYSINANFSKIWNKVVDLHGLDNQISGNYIYKEGEAIGSYYMYQANGLFRDQADLDGHAKQSNAAKPGDIRFNDINGDGVINQLDRTITGNDVPYFTYGLSLSAGYKGFDVQVIGQGVSNVKVYFSEEAAFAFFNGAAVKQYHLGRWTKENPNSDAAYPRMLTSADDAHNRVVNSFWLFNADYFRIKELSLGYSLPQSLTKKIGIERLRVYVSSNNIATIKAEKRMKDFDPESASGRPGYPQVKTTSFGLNLTF